MSPAISFVFSITQNQTSIAIVERNSQSAHIFDKQTKKHIDEVENRLRTKGIFRLWNVLVSEIQLTCQNFSNLFVSAS